MRIGVVCPYDMSRPGGVQDQVVRLAGWLRERGHAVVVVAPGDHDDSGFVSVGPATVIRANGAATPLALSRDAAGRTLAAIEGCDVVHVHEPLMPRVSLAVLRRARQPLVGTFHADVSKIAALAYTLGRPISGRWLRRLAVITAVSPIAERVVAHTRRARIIPNGIDVGRYGGGEPRPDSVVFLGRNDPRKGLPVLLEAWREVHSAHPEATLTVVGSDQPGSAIPGVAFTGRVSEADKRRYLSESAVYCAPHLGGESFGIVVAEAMASGCAVVASGLPAFVRVAGDTASYTAPGDARGLAAAIAGLISDRVLSAQMGQAARERVRRFDGAAVAGAYLQAYDDALTASTQRSRPR